MRKIRYPDDCIEVRDTLEKLGYPVTLYEAEAFWEWRSELYSAGWLNVIGRDLMKEIAAVISTHNPDLDDREKGFFLPEIY